MSKCASSYRVFPSVLALLLFAGAASAAEGPPGEQESGVAALLAPPLSQPMTRLHFTLRPFLITPGLGVGMISEARLERYFTKPLVLGVELRPVALLASIHGSGAIGRLVGTLGYAGRYLNIQLGGGGQFQQNGLSGAAFAGILRLGALDGLNLLFSLGYSLIKGYYTRAFQFALDHLLGELNLPLRRRLVLNLSGGFGMDLWAYATAGLRHHLRGRGGRGTLALTGALGAALAMDRFPCQYHDPAPCRRSARGFGPTLATGLDARF